MIWVAGRSPTLVSYSLRGVAMNLKATTLTYLAIVKRGCCQPAHRSVVGLLATGLLKKLLIGFKALRLQHGGGGVCQPIAVLSSKR